MNDDLKQRVEVSNPMMQLVIQETGEILFSKSVNVLEHSWLIKRTMTVAIYEC